MRTSLPRLIVKMLTLCSSQLSRQWRMNDLVSSFLVSDGFTFVKRHQATLIQRLKSVEPVLEHLREQNVLCKFLFFPFFGQ